ncbi:glycerol-3-phosphate 1-O-acyltransferase PlsY [Mycoplasma leonicaptivi]|uniref:glycerol-3-phosphate 1-O-acyltransferase PlsY n=1 Tax=Mycoplasma leonicaptivi TaxID=36742 RepID=UPI001FE1B5B2|nr:glycerol-3-phosphate 1-O-acyltransferase PlsY [Mycoplasma leonicaptivi]
MNLTFLGFGYIVGSLNTALLYAKFFKQKDLREFYSKNAGATNSLRVYGKKVALIILLIDIAKVVISVLLMKLIAQGVNNSIQYDIDNTLGFKEVNNLESKLFLIPLLSGLGVVIGHTWPVFFNLKGGKGVACGIGLIISINIIIFVIATIVYFSILFWKKYVSLASILTSIILIPFCFIPWITDLPLGWMNDLSVNYFWITGLIYLCVAGLIVYKHISNIKSLLNHTERKLNLFSKK